MTIVLGFETGESGGREQNMAVCSSLLGCVAVRNYALAKKTRAQIRGFEF